MQEKELKLLFDKGVLIKCIIAPAMFGDGYNAMFLSKGEKNGAKDLLETRPRSKGLMPEVRRFKTIDSAASLVRRQIGFRVFEVDLS